MTIKENAALTVLRNSEHSRYMTNRTEVEHRPREKNMKSELKKERGGGDEKLDWLNKE